MNYNLITVLGPTATGKTKLAAGLSGMLNGEIISADSRQVYRGMDIGTGKDFADYYADDKKIPYHLIDIADPSEEFNLFQFTSYFKDAFIKIISENKIPILTGGSGLYISSVIQDYRIKQADFSDNAFKRFSGFTDDELRSYLLKVKPKLHNKTDLLERERMIKAILVAESEDDSLLAGIKISSVVIGIMYERSEIRKRITERLEKRLSKGMIGEVKKLIDSGVSYERLLKFGLEYKYIALYLKNELTADEMFSKLNSAIHAFAKRQMTWFRKMEREGVKINWIENGDPEKAYKLISEHTFIPKIIL